MTPQKNDHDEAFFILRDCRELMQRRLADIARLAGVSSQAAIEAFTREFGEAHDELASASPKSSFGETAGLTASRISLVGNDQLELEIRIGELANHLKDNRNIDPWRTQLRYMTLLNRPQMLADQNPAGFEPISCGLFALCRECKQNLEKNLDLLNRLEEVLQLKLPEIYVELNALLERRSVVPAQAQVAQRSAGENRAGTTTGAANSDRADSGANPMSTLHMAMQQQLGADNRAASSSAPGSTADGTANFTLNASALVMLNHLLERLSRLEIQQTQELTDGSPTAGETGPSHLHAFNSRDIDLPLGQPAAVALDTLSLIFEAIFAGPDLPDAVKAAISRLQIPLLRMAITEPAFFSDTQHPARRLINRMALAALGLSRDTDREHPVCAALTQLADKVHSTLEAGEGTFSTHLDELDALIADRTSQIQRLATPYIQLVIEHEAAEAARFAAQTWLKKTLTRISNPVVSGFLSARWLGVMQAACIDGGATGEHWRESESVIDELLVSFQPVQTVEDRKQLIARIPLLIKRINAILDQTGVPVSERKAFLDACFEQQTAAMRNRPETGTSKPGETTSPEPLIAPLFANSDTSLQTGTVQILEQDGKLVQYLGTPGNIRTVWQKTRAKHWKEHDWINVSLPDKETYCGLLCHEAPESGTLLLFNPDRGYGIAIPFASLERQLENGQADVVSEQSLFDDAAKQALDRFSPVPAKDSGRNA